MTQSVSTSRNHSSKMLLKALGFTHLEMLPRNQSGRKRSQGKGNLVAPNAGVLRVLQAAPDRALTSRRSESLSQGYLQTPNSSTMRTFGAR